MSLMFGAANPVDLSDYHPPLDVGLQRVELEIIRGRARRRMRTVRPPVFLIGAAKDSDLALADDRFPELHSYLFCGSSEISYRWLEIGPELKVNGTPGKSGMLQDGDVLQMGSYEFRIHIHPCGPWDHPRGGRRRCSTIRIDRERARREVFNLLYDIRCMLPVKGGTGPIRRDILAS